MDLNKSSKSTDRITTEQWGSVCYQFEWEISKAEVQVEMLKSNANEMFDEAEEYLSNQATPTSTTYLNEFKRTRATYMDKLEQITLYLELARVASWKLRCHTLNLTADAE